MNKALAPHKLDIIGKAFLKNGPMSPRKVALVVNEIRGKTVAAAKRILSISLVKKKAAGLVLKLLNSAVSNAIHNNHYNEASVSDLIVAYIWVSKGLVFKRMEPRARGSGNTTLKRRSHVDLYLKEKADMVLNNKVTSEEVEKEKKIKVKKGEKSNG